MDALTAVRSFAAEHGLPSERAVVLNDGSNLIVHLAPAPVVVRVATLTAFIRRDPVPNLAREVALAGHLAAVGAAVVPPSDLLEPGPHRIGSWWGTVWRFVAHDPSAVPDALAALASLDDLRDAMATFRGALPAYGPVGPDLDAALDRCVEHGLVLAAEAAQIRHDRATLLRGVVDLPRQAQHGDAFPRNLLVTPSGLVWNDFEDCCAASPLWDLAVLARRDESGRVRAVAVDRFGTEAVATMIGLRELQSRVWNVLHDACAAGQLRTT